MLQDFTGVPLLCDLAAMRGVARRFGKDPKIVEPLVPVDLVVDHSVQVDHYRVANALDLNMRLEFQRNAERYRFIKWGMQAFDSFRVVPPGIGIVHQVNLEYLARGRLPEGATATDLVLHVTERLRRAHLVGKFVEFFGDGAASLPVPDRATIANMAPEYGATMGFFPVDIETVKYLAAIGCRPAPCWRHRPWRCSDRRDHLLHQYLEPRRDARRRAAGKKGRGPRPLGGTAGQDLAGAGFARGNRIPCRSRTAGRPGSAGLSRRRLRLHHLHRPRRATGAAVEKAIAAHDLVCAAVLSGISPAGSIKPGSPAGEYLLAHRGRRG